MHPKITALRLPSGSLGHHTLAATSCQSSRRPAFVAGFELKTQLYKWKHSTKNHKQPKTNNNQQQQWTFTDSAECQSLNSWGLHKQPTPTTTNQQPQQEKWNVFLLTWQFEPSCLGGLELDSFHDHDGWIHLRIETPRFGYPFRCTENGLKIQRFL